jgi:type II secretory pathway pseudopilin PulG
LAAIIVGVIVFMSIPVIACLAGVALGPITNGINKAKENMTMQQARQIDIAMFAYASDHNGAYPDGKTSTEVFQKLLDEKYVTDPTVFYFDMAGKTKPASDKLTAESVCFDATSGVTSDSSNDLPVVFSTGYTVTYSPGAGATRDPGVQLPFPGIVAAFKSNRAQWMGSPNFRVEPDGSIDQFVPSTFDPGTKTYQQLKP